MGWALADSAYLVGWQPRIALEGPRASSAGLSYNEWDLGQKADYDTLYHRLFQRLEDMHTAFPLDAVFFEASGANYKSEAAVWIQIGLAATIRLWAKLTGINAELVNNQKVKAHAAQYGGANKADMIYCAERLGWAPQSDHVADALFVLDFKLTQWHRS